MRHKLKNPSGFVTVLGLFVRVKPLPNKLRLVRQWLTEVYQPLSDTGMLFCNPTQIHYHQHRQQDQTLNRPPGKRPYLFQIHLTLQKANCLLAFPPANVITQNTRDVLSPFHRQIRQQHQRRLAPSQTTDN